MNTFMEKLFGRKEKTKEETEQPIEKVIEELDEQNIPSGINEEELEQLESQEEEGLKVAKENLQKIFSQDEEAKQGIKQGSEIQDDAEEISAEMNQESEEYPSQKKPEKQEGGEKISIFKRHRDKLMAGLLITITSCNSVDIGKTVDNIDVPDEEPDSISYKQSNSERRLSFEEQKKEIAELIGESQTVWEMEQCLTGSTERTGGFFVDDNGDVVIAGDLISAIQTADEDMFDAVEGMKSLEDVDNMQVKLPGILKNFKEISNHLESLMQKSAKFAFMYTHNVDLSGNGEAIHSSIQQEDIYGEKMYVHTIKPEFFGYKKSAADPIMVQPGFATTPETYKHMSVDLAMHGIQVSVVDQTTMDLDFSKKTDHFNNLPKLPQAYALAAEKGIELVSNNYTEKVDVMAYSLGSVGAAAAIEKDNNNAVDDLALFNPVGLYDVDDLWELKSVRGLELVSDVLLKHGGQVKDLSESSVRAQRIHEDITGDVAKRIKGQKFSNMFNSVDMFELGASFETTEVELGPILKNISQKVDVTIIAGGQDAFSPLEEMKEQLEDVPVQVDVKPDWSHSTMKYQQGEVSYMLRSILSGDTNK